MREMNQIDPMIGPMIPEPWKDLYATVEPNDDRKRLIEELGDMTRERDAYRDELLEMRTIHTNFQISTRKQMNALAEEIERLDSRMVVTQPGKKDEHHEKHCQAKRRVPIGGKNCTCWRPRAETAEAAIPILIAPLRRVKNLWNIGAQLDMPTVTEINHAIAMADPHRQYRKGSEQK